MSRHASSDKSTDAEQSVFTKDVGLDESYLKRRRWKRIPLDESIFAMFIRFLALLRAAMTTIKKLDYTCMCNRACSLCPPALYPGR